MSSRKQAEGSGRKRSVESRRLHTVLSTPELVDAYDWLVQQTGTMGDAEILRQGLVRFYNEVRERGEVVCRMVEKVDA
jgi:ribosomal protein L27